jgi:hypothetical protein
MARKRKTHQSLLYCSNHHFRSPCYRHFFLLKSMAILSQLLLILVFLSNYIWLNVKIYLYRFECIGSSAIYRLSLSLLCLFVLMMILMLCFNKCSQIINEGLFCIKYLLVVGLFIGFLWISNSVFMDYSKASQGISIVFMILQVNFMSYLGNYSNRSFLYGQH